MTVLLLPGATRFRWLASLILGAVLGLAVFFATNVVPEIVMGRHLEGGDYAVVGLMQIALVPVAVWIGLKPAGVGLRDIGWRGPRVGGDFALGLGVALVFAIVQFAVLIPMTGGAARSDVAVNSAQIGGSLLGVGGFVVFAWTGGVAEELLYRGHILMTLRNALGLKGAITQYAWIKRRADRHGANHRARVQRRSYGPATSVAVPMADRALFDPDFDEGAIGCSRQHTHSIIAASVDARRRTRDPSTRIGPSLPIVPQRHWLLAL